MAKGLNKVQLIGNATADADQRTTKTGATFATFTVAVNESWKDKNGDKQERTEFVSCIAFSKLGEIAGQYIRKGEKVYVEGRLQQTKQEGTDGTTRYFTNVVLDNFILLGGKRGDSAPAQASPAAANDGLPF